MSTVSVFVGSSTKGLDAARAIQRQLTDTNIRVQLWNEGVFRIGYGTWESLLRAMSRFDFAVLVMTPDDAIVVNDATEVATRDNVLIELGLFTGRLGRDRTFLVSQRTKGFRVPSDLLGVAFAEFSKPDNDADWNTAVGPACTDIRDAIKRAGNPADVNQLAQSVKEQQERSQDQARQIEKQQEMINQLTKYGMSASIFHHLCGVALLNTYEYVDNDTNRREFYFLRDNGLIMPRGRDFLIFDGSIHLANIVSMAEPTPIGWLCVKLRKAEIPSNMLRDRGNQRIDPETL